MPCKHSNSQDCEPSLLYELVMRLQMHMYLPNDYLCYCGDVAKVH